MKKIILTTLGVLLFGWTAVSVLSEVNYQEALAASQLVETDGEIMEVMESHGFELGNVYDEIGPMDKIKALFR